MKRGRGTKHRRVAVAKRLHKSRVNSKRYQHALPIRISKHAHTGKMLPIHCTSYALLFFLLIFIGLLLFFSNQKIVQAANEINVSGIVAGPAPTDPAVIVSPQDQASFSTSTAEVSGTCTPSLIVETYRNNSFAGSTVCSGSGTFAVTITLLVGQNELIAKIKDALDQYGPDSNMITVTYTIPDEEEPSEEEPGGDDGGSDGGGTDLPDEDGETPPSTDEGSQTPPQLIIKTSSVIRHIKVGEPFRLHFRVTGGTAPFAVSINWGDGWANSLYSYDEGGRHSVRHAYELGGSYLVEITITDVTGQKAVIWKVVVVDKGKDEDTNTIIGNLQPQVCKVQPGGDGAASGNDTWCAIARGVEVVWPAFVISSGLTLSFWTGEKFVYWRVRKVLKLAKR